MTNFFSKFFGGTPDKFKNIKEAYGYYQKGKLNDQQKRAFEIFMENSQLASNNPMDKVIAQYAEFHIKMGNKPYSFEFMVEAHKDEYTARETSQEDIQWRINTFESLLNAYKLQAKSMIELMGGYPNHLGICISDAEARKAACEQIIKEMQSN